MVSKQRLDVYSMSARCALVELLAATLLSAACCRGRVCVALVLPTVAALVAASHCVVVCECGGAQPA